MERIVWITIGKKNYPMCFSIGAQKKIEDKYGSFKGFYEACKKNETVTEAYVYGLETLIQYGCKRLNVLSDPTIKENGSISEEGEWLPISQEELEIMRQAEESLNTALTTVRQTQSAFKMNNLDAAGAQQEEEREDPLADDEGWA